MDVMSPGQPQENGAPAIGAPYVFPGDVAYMTHDPLSCSDLQERFCRGFMNSRLTHFLNNNDFQKTNDCIEHFHRSRPFPDRNGSLLLAQRSAIFPILAG
jgi:hypothetical protein